MPLSAATFSASVGALLDPAFQSGGKLSTEFLDQRQFLVLILGHKN
jgi:hypothetical protein